jgi:[ribosomal protein S5]-alanine N-acetyltransferase
VTVGSEQATVHAVGDRLVLRDFVTADEAAVHAFTSDAEVTRFTDWGPNEPQDTHDFIASAVAQTHDVPRREFNLAAVHGESGRLIGSVAIGVTNEEHRRGELGYVFHPDFWSQGFAAEAARLLLNFGFRHLQLRRITATCHPENTASARVLEKIGMQHEGTLRSHLLVRGTWRDSLLYAAINNP